jgi:hypothetical protein
MFELAKRGKAEHPSKEAEFKLISCCALKLLGRADEAKKESETIYVPEEVDAFRYVGKLPKKRSVHFVIRTLKFQSKTQ